MSNKYSKWGFPDIAIFVVWAALMVAGCVLSFLDKTASAGATYGAGIICILFAFLDRIKAFSGLGIKAEMWEKKVEEAETLIVRLRDLSAVMAEPILMLAPRMGRWNTALTHIQQYELVKSMEEELRVIGLSEIQIQKAMRDVYRYTVFDLSQYVSAHIRIVLKVKFDQAKTKIDRWPQPIQDIDAFNAGNKEFQRFKDEYNKFELICAKMEGDISAEYRSYVQTTFLVDEKERAEIFSNMREEWEDLDFYVKNRKFRRLEVWLARR